MNHIMKAPRAGRLLAALSALVLLVTTLPITANADDRWDNNYRNRIQARIQAERLEAERARLRAKALRKQLKNHRPPLHSNARIYRDNRYYGNRYYNPANRWQQANVSNYWRNANFNRNWDGRW